MDEITEKEEDLLDELGSGVEEFEDEGDFLRLCQRRLRFERLRRAYV